MSNSNTKEKQGAAKRRLVMSLLGADELSRVAGGIRFEQDAGYCKAPDPPPGPFAQEFTKVCPSSTN
jgi:hypothetical protein